MTAEVNVLSLEPSMSMDSICPLRNESLSSRLISFSRDLQMHRRWGMRSANTPVPRTVARIIERENRLIDLKSTLFHHDDTVESVSGSRNAMLT